MIRLHSTEKPKKLKLQTQSIFLNNFEISKRSFLSDFSKLFLALNLQLCQKTED